MHSEWASTSLAFASGATVAVMLLGLYNKRRTKSVSITLPNWLISYEKSLATREFKSDEEMMAVAIQVAHENVQQGTGGPFGCAIFERDNNTTTPGGQKTSRLFSVGANRVTVLNNSTLHGETVAIQYGEQKLEHFSFRSAGASKGKEYILCTSCEPCAMCIGATLWSGCHEMICSAAKEDAEAIGFNEGPVFEESYKQLEAAGIKIKRNVLRTEGAKVLEDYGKTGIIYNS